MQFIADYLRQRLDMTELHQLYGISRKTGYKWIGRYVTHGLQGLDNRTTRLHRVRWRPGVICPGQQ